MFRAGVYRIGIEEKGNEMVNGRIPTSALLLGVACSGLISSTTWAQAETDGSTLVEVVVTAQRRSERIEDVPMSINAFDQNTLKDLAINSTDDLQFATPGIVNTMTSGDGISAIYIRGVGTGYSGPGLEGSVAVYVDDVYLQTQTSSAQSAIDVAQIQVLKGPQGTLYGRNATGGAVIVETNDPVLEEFDGSVQLGYGNLDWLRGEAIVNLPVSSTVALRFAGFLEERDGYVSNVAVPGFEDGGVGSGSTYGGRLKALWQPSENFRTVAKIEYDRRNGNGAMHSLRINPDGTPTALGFDETSQSPNREGGGGDDTESMLGSLRVEYSWDIWQVSNTLAYREASSFGCTDNDGVVEELLYFCLVSHRSPNPGTADGKVDKTLTNELRFTSESDGPVDVVAGAFFERNHARFAGRIGGAFFGGTTPTFDNRDELTAYSAYVDLNWQLTDALKLTGGLRYTHEDKEHNVTLDQDAIDLMGGTAPVYDEDETSFENVSPRLVLSYDAGAMNYYVSYNEGFKSGGFNSPALTIDPPLDPEKIDAYEIGAKYRSGDGRVSLSSAIFYYDWSDVQVAFITGGGAGIQQQNAAGAENYGAELNLNWAPADDWRVNAGVGYTHARFTNFPQAAVYNLIGGTLTADAEDLRGRPVPQSPDMTVNASVTYRFDLPSSWSGNVTAAGRYSSDYDFSAGAGGELRASHQDALTLVNLTGSFRPGSGTYEIGWFVANALDEEFYELMSTGTTGVYVTPSAPRTYGATVRWFF